MCCVCACILRDPCVREHACVRVCTCVRACVPVCTCVREFRLGCVSVGRRVGLADVAGVHGRAVASRARGICAGHGVCSGTARQGTIARNSDNGLPV